MYKVLWELRKEASNQARIHIGREQRTLCSGVTPKVLKDERKFAREIRWRKTFQMKRDSTPINGGEGEYGTFREWQVICGVYSGESYMRVELSDTGSEEIEARS